MQGSNDDIDLAEGKKNELDLFGGSRPWLPSEWTASDDRVRGGKSQSYLDCSPKNSDATFRGLLDIKTLGGAGFASQRTTAESEVWDLSAFDGVRIEIVTADETTYTFIVKDDLLPRNPENGREQATVSWETDFSTKVNKGSVNTLLIEIPWADFKPTYRGKPKEGAGKIDTTKIRRFSLMTRSFFGEQEGSFKLTVRSIKAYKGARCSVGKIIPFSPYHDEQEDDHEINEKQAFGAPARRPPAFAWLLECLGLL